MMPSSGYQPLSRDEERILDALPEKRAAWAQPGNGGVQSNWMWLVHALLLSFSMTLFTISFWSKPPTPNITDPKMLEQISTWSPIFPAVKYESRKYDIPPIMVDNPYVGYGPSVDRAWDVIANNAADIMITEEERVKLGLSPESLKIQHPVTGEWGYRVGVEAFHQLHCLNLLRQAVYKDYYGNKEIGGDVGSAHDEHELVGHLDHCIEALRLNLMCQSDVSVFGFKTFPELADKGITGEWPDFEINHQCRNFEAIKEFNNNHAVAWDHDV